MDTRRSARRRPTLAHCLVPLLMLVAWCAGLPCRAEGGPKIAVVDIERVLTSSQAGKAALADLKKQGERKEAELRARAQELKDLQTKINDGRLSLAQDKLTELSKEYEDKELAFRRGQDDASREMKKQQEAMLARVDAQTMPVINQLAKELGYDLIFRKFESGLLYASDAMDITSLVIGRLDASAPKSASPTP